MTTCRIGVAGAGLLGRLLAWRLAGLGHAVTVFDPAAGPLDRGQAAGWTAAGMLSPWAELESADGRVADLGVRSLAQWGDIADQLPQPVHFRRDGSLLLAHRSDLGAAQRLVALLQAKMPPGEGPHPLTEAQLQALEPSVHGPSHAWRLDGEGQIDAVRAMHSLAEGATQRGACWRWGQTVRELAAGRIEGIGFDAVFDVRGCGAKPDLPVRGVRGEIVWVHAPGVRLGRPLRLLHPRWRVYLVPRADDIVLVGASEIESEDRGPISVRSLLGLLSAAHSVLPELAEGRVVHTETNLRPAMPDNLPLVEHRPGLVRINGLFRHGWLIAPALVEDALQQAGLATPVQRTVQITLNGSTREVRAASALADLVDDMGHAPEAVATALNGEFVARGRRHERTLHHGDQVTFFQPIVGG
jgi:glycine oxidase